MTTQTVTPPSADAALVAFHIIGIAFVAGVLLVVALIAIGAARQSTRKPNPPQPYLPPDVDIAGLLEDTRAIDEGGAR